MTPESFARSEYRDWIIYRELAAMEKSSEFKAVLSRFVEQERKDFEFWRERSSRKKFRVSMFEIWWFRMTRRLLGLAFTAKLLEGRERDAHTAYAAYLKTVRDPVERAFLERAVEQERGHERELIERIEAKSLHVVSSIVLGVNDGLIELSGALTGFALAFQNSSVVALSGIITGIAAALSMTASAYLQAAHEEGKNAWRAGIYTGISYLVVVTVMVAPFLLFDSLAGALAAMLVVMAGIVATLSFYTAVLFERRFGRQFRTMMLLSIGVAVIAFGMGLVARMIWGVEV